MNFRHKGESPGTLGARGIHQYLSWHGRYTGNMLLHGRYTGNMILHWIYPESHSAREIHGEHDTSREIHWDLSAHGRYTGTSRRAGDTPGTLGAREKHREHATLREIHREHGITWETHTERSINGIPETHPASEKKSVLATLELNQRLPNPPDALNNLQTYVQSQASGELKSR